MQGKIERQSAQRATARNQHSRIIQFALKVAIMALLSGPPLLAVTPVVCIPPPTNRVPGLPGPPNWVGTISPPNPPVRTEFDDPRWDGAASLTWANGTSGDTARFRALRSGNNLFLS